MKEITAVLIFCGLANIISASSAEYVSNIRRYEPSTSSGPPYYSLPKKLSIPTYPYSRPYIKPRPTYATLDDLIYNSYPVKKPQKPNKKKPIYSYQHATRPITKFPTPQKPNEVDYADRPNNPNQVYASNQIYIKPKPTPSTGTYPKPNPSVSHSHASTYSDSNAVSSYQGMKPTPIYQIYPSYHDPVAEYIPVSPHHTSYPSQYLQEPSSTYEDEYPSQFYEIQQEVPEKANDLSQYLQNGNNLLQDDVSYYDKVVFYPYEEYSYRPNSLDDIYDYPEIMEELGAAFIKSEREQERSLRRQNAEDDDQTPIGRTYLFPYKTWEYKPPSHGQNLHKIWKTKFYHPYKGWSYKKMHYLHYLHSKFRKPVFSPHRYLNADKSKPWSFNHLPLLSTRPANVHRIRNSGEFVLDKDDSLSSTQDNYSDDLFNDYVKRPTSMDYFYQRRSSNGK